GVHQHTQDIRGCPCVSVCGRQHTHDVRGCPSVHISACWSSDSARWPFSWTVWVILAHVGCLFITHRTTSVGVRQHTQDHTQDVRGCPSVHISARWSLDSARWPFPGTVWVILAHVGCLFSTHRTSVGVRQHIQDHTHDVCGCPCVSLCVRQHSQDIRGCPCVSMCVRQNTQDVGGCPSVYISAHWSLDSARWPFSWTVWQTQDIRDCLSVHISACWSLDSEHLPFPWTVR
ncbi:unnamed protein product, partial [Brassica rapa]